MPTPLVHYLATCAAGALVGAAPGTNPSCLSPADAVIPRWNRLCLHSPEVDLDDFIPATYNEGTTQKHTEHGSHCPRPVL